MMRGFVRRPSRSRDWIAYGKGDGGKRKIVVG
jgi:hypothetical protein